MNNKESTRPTHNASKVLNENQTMASTVEDKKRWLENYLKSPSKDYVFCCMHFTQREDFKTRTINAPPTLSLPLISEAEEDLHFMLRKASSGHGGDPPGFADNYRNRLLMFAPHIFQIERIIGEEKVARYFLPFRGEWVEICADDLFRDVTTETATQGAQKFDFTCDIHQPAWELGVSIEKWGCVFPNHLKGKTLTRLQKPSGKWSAGEDENQPLPAQPSRSFNSAGGYNNVTALQTGMGFPINGLPIRNRAPQAGLNERGTPRTSGDDRDQTNRNVPAHSNQNHFQVFRNQEQQPQMHPGNPRPDMGFAAHTHSNGRAVMGQPLAEYSGRIPGTLDNLQQQPSFGPNPQPPQQFMYQPHLQQHRQECIQYQTQGGGLPLNPPGMTRPQISGQQQKFQHQSQNQNRGLSNNVAAFSSLQQREEQRQRQQLQIHQRQQQRLQHVLQLQQQSRQPPPAPRGPSVDPWGLH